MHRFRPLLPFLLFILLLAADFALKSYVVDQLPRIAALSASFPFGGLPLLQWGPVDVSLVYAINRGAALGLLVPLADILIYVRMLIIASLVTYLLFFNSERRRILPFTLLIAGALGNVIDYFRFGYVVDMFHCRFWGYSFPIFNIADSAICVGVALLLLIPNRPSLALKP